jgi:hypothetical protein
MKSILEDGPAQIAFLQADLVRYRRLAEERKAVGDLAISVQLVRLIGTVERRIAELEASSRKV